MRRVSFESIATVYDRPAALQEFLYLCTSVDLLPLNRSLESVL